MTAWIDQVVIVVGREAGIENIYRQADKPESPMGACR
jgi:hypothetical protein